jgi:hypothetical protein
MKTEVSEQQRIIEDLMVQNFDGWRSARSTRTR